MLEKLVAMRLFDRSSTGVALTESGSRLLKAVTRGLELIHHGVAEAEEFSRESQVVISCSHEASIYLLLPRYNELCAMLGDSVRVRMVNFWSDPLDVPTKPVADVEITWNAARAEPGHRVPMLREAVRPVCSPAYADAHAAVLNGPVADWSTLAFIDYTRPNDGWATWDDWFAATDHPRQAPRYLDIESYPYVLEAAVAGRGIALGWRGFMDQHLASGALIELGERLVEFDNYCYCALTEKGREKPAARKCLEFFKS